jgi:hypothetical protein
MGQSISVYRRTGGAGKSVQFSQQFLVYHWITDAAGIRCGTDFSVYEVKHQTRKRNDKLKLFLMCRLLAGMWYFFALIMIASYTANLAAFLTVETLERPIENADDLASQTVIKFGTLKGGSTMRFFQESTMEPFRTMWAFMSGKII